MDCFHCGQKGHIKRHCPTRRGKKDMHEKPAASAEKSAAAEAQDFIESDDGEGSDPESSAAAVTGENQVVKKPHIVDSGSTSHYCGEPENPLSNFVPKEVSVSLGDQGAKVMFHGSGDFGKLQNVLWTPADKEGLYSIFGDREALRGPIRQRVHPGQAGRRAVPRQRRRGRL